MRRNCSTTRRSTAHPAGRTETFSTGLPQAALGERSLRDLFSASEAGFAFRFPVGDLPTLPREGHRAIPAPADLPTEGLQIGRDTGGGNPIFLGTERNLGHTWLLGATGSGKTTSIRAAANRCLREGTPFVVLDPHGDLTRAIRADAFNLGCEIALIDADEDETLALDLLDGVRPATASPDDLDRPVARLLEAHTSHLPDPRWAGPVFFKHFRDSLLVTIGASASFRLRLEHVARLLVDPEFAEPLLNASTDARAVKAMRQLFSSRDYGETAAWVASKAEDVALNPGARRR